MLKIIIVGLALILFFYLVKNFSYKIGDCVEKVVQFFLEDNKESK